MEYEGRYTVGEIIRKLREQMGLSRAKLLDHGIDESTLVRIEKGSIKAPTYTTLEPILEKLGLDPLTDLRAIFDEDTIRVRGLKAQLNGFIETQKLEDAQRVITELEGIEEHTKSIYNRQYISYAKIAIASYKADKIPADIRAMATKAIKLTIVNFKEEEIENYLLSRTVMKLINIIAGMYFEEGNLKQAIAIMSSLKRNFEKNIIDESEIGKRYPKLMYHLAKYLTLDGQHEKAIGMCDEVVDICKNTGQLRYLPYMLSTKASALYHLDREDEAKLLLKQTSVIFLAYNMHKERKMLNIYAKDNFGIDIDSVLI